MQAHFIVAVRNFYIMQAHFIVAVRNLQMLLYNVSTLQSWSKKLSYALI